MGSLREYIRKRPPGQSPEPRGGRATSGKNSFVVQRHDATRLHYDFRLEINGVLKSWAVPKGPSLDPSVKRLAVETEDHPLDYGGFEGQIPAGNYGAGEVILWDRGTYETEGTLSAQEQYERGEIKFQLQGEKLQGGFVLVKLRKPGTKKEWLLIKHRDDAVRTDWNIEEHGRSVKSGKSPKQTTHVSRKKPVTILTNRARELKNAVKSAMPERLHPALPTLGEQPTAEPDWLYEIKWDGIRVLLFVENGKTKLIARSGRDITAEYPEFQDFANNVRARTAILDGEIVVLDERGRSVFQRLQARFGVTNPPVKMREQAPPTLYLFDALYGDGFDIRRAPLLERKKLLSQIVVASDMVRISDHQVGQGPRLFAEASKNGIEGIVGKRIDSCYPEGRTTSWLKFKTVAELDAVVGGWTAPRRSREHFGSLLVGLYSGTKLQFIGGVGTGFTREVEAAAFQKLQKLPADKCPFFPIPRTKEQAHWVQPELVAKVGFAEWTGDEHLRQPRFLGWQPDREAQECTFEKEKSAKSSGIPPGRESPSGKKRPPQTAAVTNATSQLQARTQESPPARKPNGDVEKVLAALEEPGREEVRMVVEGEEVKLTHLHKVYFPNEGYTKRDVLRYYATVSSALLPFLEERPLVLHRYPNGIGGAAFYQKDAGPSIPEWIKTVQIYSETKKENIAYFIADNLAALLYLVNLGCIEQNPFSAREDDLEMPDYMFVDLDPTDGTPFSRVVRAAQILTQVLHEAKLKSFVKTSGATGIHVFVPIVRKYKFEQVRALLEIMTRMAMEREKGLLTREFRVQQRPKNSVFVDVRQNAYAQSLASVFSIRPRTGAPVSTPLRAGELKASLRPENWNLQTVLKHFSERKKIWKDFWKQRQTLEGALTALENRKGG